MTNVITLKNIKKDYKTIKGKIEVLRGVDYTFEKGKFYAIKGHSGSGKTTLIRILGLLDNPTSGEYLLYNKETKNLNDYEASDCRLKHIGFIFQEYNLNKEIDKKDRKELCSKLLKLVDLSDRANHFPRELSGGEQQRVAIARALANDPDIIIADEPTGNLDKENEKVIFKLLKELSKKDKCVIVIK